ncbi:MAG: hypothetical protein A3K60_02470 [Euryarchaeota archaeon RBG_19FT_COMBO_56_21]|nr:MAG: hypothetical protein A3K60_02470 [Euryarchaeota archaeon RBG_19FT_COMBO_56_21]
MIITHVRGHSALRERDEDLDTSWFSQLDPRVKIVGVFSFVVVAALLTRPEGVTIALTAAIALAAASRVSAKRLIVAYAAAFPFVALASASIFLFSGWDRGLTMLARTSSCVIPLLVLALGTETFDLFSGLRRLKVPGMITTLLMLTFRFLLLLSDELERMKVSRQARGFRGGRSLLDRYGLRVLSFTAGMVLVRASARADRVYEGLRCKAFRKDMIPWRTSSVRSRDMAFLACLAIVAGVLAAVQYEVLF